MMLQGLELFRLEMDSMRERFNVEMKKMETVNWATEGVQDGQRSRSLLVLFGLEGMETGGGGGGVFLFFVASFFEDICKSGTRKLS